jgi:hypothetical protein
MKKKDFDNLVASVREAGRIRRGEAEASRVTEIAPVGVKAIRHRRGKGRRLLDDVRREAVAYPRFVTAAELRRMAAGRAPRDRLRALWLMRRQIEEGGLRAAYLKLARPLIADEDNDCRWQALIVVGEFIETQPEKVWQVVRKYGASPDEDMRDAVACVLLEHLLEHHFKAYFPRVEELALANPLFGDTFERCWKFGQSERPANAKRFDALKRRLGR